MLLNLKRTKHKATVLTVLSQVGMDKNIASLSVPLGQLKEEVLVRVFVWSRRPSQSFQWNKFCSLVANKYSTYSLDSKLFMNQTHCATGVFLCKESSVSESINDNYLNLEWLSHSSHIAQLGILVLE